MATLTENKPVKIKSIVLTSTGSSSDYSNLQIKEENYPKLEKENQVIVRVKAAGLNFAELMQRQGIYQPRTKTPYTPGYEASGVVEQIGEGVTDLSVGDRVVVFNSSDLWKEVISVQRLNVVKIPDDMSFEDAAALVVNYITAYQILFRQARLQSGDSVLIHMAAGGVGMAVTQLCKTVPNVTVFGTASGAKHEAIKQNGVDYPIDYTTTDYVEEVKKISPTGVDLVLDPLNGDNAIKGYGLLKPLGRIIHFGAASMAGESRSLIGAFKTWWKCLSTNSLEIMSDNKTIGGYHLGVLAARKQQPPFMAEIMTDLGKLFELYEQKKIHIQIDSSYPYSKVGDAMKRMHTRKNVGKVILKPDSEFPVLVVAPEQVGVVTTAEATSEQSELASAEETPKVDLKVETPKAEAPKIETPKVEAPKVETPKAEAPKVDTPKAEAPKFETPKAVATSVIVENNETPKVESAQQD